MVRGPPGHPGRALLNAPSHAVGRCLGPSTPRPVNGGSFELTPSPRSNPVTRGPRAYRVSHREVSAYRPRSKRRAVRTWRGCGVAQRAERSSPRRRPSPDPTKTRPIGGGGFGTSCSLCSNNVARGPRVCYPVKARPTARGTRAFAHATRMPAARWRSQFVRRTTTTIWHRERKTFRRCSTLP